MRYCRSQNKEIWTPKRAVWTVGPGSNAPATAPAPSIPQAELQAFRESIENKSPEELKTEFDAQSNTLWKQQQTIMEIVEDLNAPNANIPQATKNTLILHIAKAMENNQQLIVSEQLKFSLGSHLKPGKSFEEWSAKVGLMAGTLGSMSEGMDDSAPIGKRISGMMRWIKVLIAIIRGKTIAAPESATNTSNNAPSTAPAAEAVPAFATKAALENIAIVDNADARNSGYLMVNVQNRSIKIKHDGSEIVSSNQNETHPLATFLKSKAVEMKRNTNVLGKTSPSDQARYAQAMLEQQQEMNKTDTPVDVSSLVNDNMSWALSQGSYNGNEAFFNALIEKPAGGGLNPLMTALKGRYESVRNTMSQLNTSKVDVKTKFNELSQFMISKLPAGAGKDAAEKAIKDRLDMAVSNARSVQAADTVYGLAMSQLVSETTSITTIPAGGENPYSSLDDAITVGRKIQEVAQFIGQKKAALRQSS